MKNKTYIIAAALFGFAFTLSAEPLPMPTEEQNERFRDDLIAADPDPADIPAWTDNWEEEEGVRHVKPVPYLDAVLDVIPSEDWESLAQAAEYTYVRNMPQKAVSDAVKEWDLPRDFAGASEWWGAADEHISFGRRAWMVGRDVFGSDTIMDDVSAAAELDPRIVFQQSPREGIGEDEAVSWALALRRITRWNDTSIRNTIKATGVTLVRAGLRDLAADLMDYAREGGDDPLAEAEYTSEMQAIVDDLPSDADVWKCLKGDFDVIYDEAYDDMLVADLDEDAGEKEEAAKRIARAILAKTGSVVPANKWLDAVSDETWKDHETGLSE